MLGSGSGMGKMGETERDFGRSSDGICKEYVARQTLELMAS